MVSTAQLSLVISGRDEASKVLKDIGASSDGLGSKLSGLGTVMGGVLAAGALSGGLSKAIGLFGSATEAASNLQQSTGGVQSVFGDAAAGILKFGETAANSVGLSKNAFNELAAPLGAMLKNAGFSMDEVGGKTIDLTQRAADMAATFGGPVDEAVSAITAALRGESDPIEKYGVSLKAADIEARALADSGKKTAKELTSQELAAARLALIFDQTASSAGQFGRESDTAAGKAERLKAKQENLSAQMGQYLLPITVKLTEAKVKLVEVLATKVVPAMAKLQEPVQQLVGHATDAARAFIDFAISLQPVAEAIGGAVWDALVATWRDNLVPAFRAAVDIFNALKGPLGEAAGYAGELASAIADRLAGPLSAVLDFLGAHKDEIKVFAAALALAVPVVYMLAAAHTAQATAATAAAAAEGVALLPVLLISAAIAALVVGIVLLVKNWDTITQKFPALGAAADGVRAGLQAFTSWITTTFVPKVLDIYDGVKDAVDKSVKYVSDHWDDIKAVIEPALKALGIIISTAWAQFKTDIETALGVIQGVVDVFMGVFTGDWQRAWDGVKQIVESVWNGMKGTIENAIGLIKGLAPLIRDAGEALGKALLEGLKSALSATAGFAGDVASAVLNAVKSIVNSQVIDRINRTLEFSFDTNIPGIGKISINPPDLPHLAMGGPVVAGRPYIVGEQGTELFVPSENGRIVPNHELGAGAPALHFHGPVYITATDRDDATRSMRDISFALRAMGG